MMLKGGTVNINPDFVAPCGLYCGVCAISSAHRDNNSKFKERLVDLYKGGISGKGLLPNSEQLSVDDIQCGGCLSDKTFQHCRQCEIRACIREKGYSGCHACDDFPCRRIDNFPMTVGKKVILRAIPHWRKVGTEQWIRDEETRYVRPECGNKVFRGAEKCNQFKTSLDLDRQSSETTY